MSPFTVEALSPEWRLVDTHPLECAYAKVSACREFLYLAGDPAGQTWSAVWRLIPAYWDDDIDHHLLLAVWPD
ncbi:hypothetical protein K8O93_00715 [Gordonia bronchialis]|uniref:hypothetical protein n=1 Tax=Gordonia bronchialis TaxID=2054 RepID=UPI001CBF0B7A|nr:hypothetical protein [Gordonia bronchialis]UAK38355.1 hypothetical protein K8O93_00715 [Gordonia bronchialis]